MMMGGDAFYEKAAFHHTCSGDWGWAILYMHSRICRPHSPVILLSVGEIRGRLPQSDWKTPYIIYCSFSMITKRSHNSISVSWLAVGIISGRLITSLSRSR